jgi:type II secretion system protein N
VRFRRLVLAAAIAGSVFAAVLALTFPTDAIVRSVVARISAPGSLAFVFERARLRPWGLRLEQVALRGADGAMLADAEWLTLRPSLTGFLRDRTGRPWRAAAGACAGTVGAVADGNGTGHVVSLTWKDVDLAHCPAFALLGETVAGLLEGTAQLRGMPPAGEGELVVRSGLWKGAGGLVPGVEVLHVDPAALRWTLGDGRLTLTAITVEGPDVHATGSGTVRLASALRESALDLKLTVVAAPEAPPALHDLLARLPPAPEGGDARRLDVGGTIDAPRPVRAP